MQSLPNNSDCEYAAEGFDCDGICLEGSNVTLTLSDSYGDGGGSVTINGDTYVLEGGSSADFVLCLDVISLYRCYLRSY